MAADRKRKRRRRGNASATLLACILAVGVALTGVILVCNRLESGSGSGSGPADPASAGNQQPAQPVSAPATPTPSPTPDPAEAQQTAWNAAAAATLDAIAAQIDGFDPTVQQGFPYLLAVNRAASTVTVYADDGQGRYSVPYMAMVCSGGSDTPLGFFNTPVSYGWRLLSGPCYGQYATRIWDSYLFHSVPYYTQHKDDLEYDEFNKLGTPASLGCIRLAVVDVKWIYDTCPIGTPVVIYDDEANPGPMGKPATLTIDPTDEGKRGWDPTDPDPANPWGSEYLAGTAIRSAAAQAEWDAAQADGRWNGGLNPTDLQGWSHDSSIEGTRG